MTVFHTWPLQPTDTTTLRLYHHPLPAGLELHVPALTDVVTLVPGQRSWITTSVFVHVPPGSVGLVVGLDPATTDSRHLTIEPSLHTSALDGPVRVCLRNSGFSSVPLVPGQLIAQLVCAKFDFDARFEGTSRNDSPSPVFHS